VLVRLPVILAAATSRYAARQSGTLIASRARAGRLGQFQAAPGEDVPQDLAAPPGDRVCPRPQPPVAEAVTGGVTVFPGVRPQRQFGAQPRTVARDAVVCLSERDLRDRRVAGLVGAGQEPVDVVVDERFRHFRLDG
jgi:hypothetical protein